ncbi:g11855 [Coccomyxa elongata]
MAKHKWEAEVTAALGTVWRRREFWKQLVVISDPVLLQEVFALEREGAIEKPDSLISWDETKDKNVLTSKTADPMWKLVRKGTAPAFQPNNMRQYHHHIVDIIERLIQGIKQKGSAPVIDVADIAQRESFDTIGKIGFGRDFAASRDIDNTVNNTFRLLTNDFEESMRRAVFPLRRYSRSQDKLAADANHRRVRAVIEALVKDCQNRPPSNEDAGSIAGHLLRLRDARGKPLTTERLIEEFEIFFIAGSETTGHTIAWTLYFLATHPKAMARLEAELDAAGLLKTAANPQPRTVTYADISKLHFLDCAVKEAMRLQPVAAQPLRRVTTRDIRLSSGHLIPAGVFVELAQYSVMRSKAWGWEEGDAFKPERWEEPDVEYFEHSRGSGGRANNTTEDDLEINGSKARDGKVKRYNPFGQGVRNCLGQQLARMNVPTAVAMFVSEFEFTVAPEDAQKSIDELEVLKGTLQPKSGIHMICKQR